MKTFIENPYKNGIFTLPIQISPLSIIEFKNTFVNTKVIAYGFSGAFPSWRTFQVASSFLLYFDNKKVIILNSLLTSLDDSWEEYGSLNIKVHDNVDAIPNNDLSTEIFNIEPIEITLISKLICQDEKVLIDCGIILSGSENYEIEIAAGHSMSVTVRAPFSTGKFEPDIYEELFQRVPL